LTGADCIRGIGPREGTGRKGAKSKRRVSTMQYSTYHYSKRRGGTRKLLTQKSRHASKKRMQKAGTLGEKVKVLSVIKKGGRGRVIERG